MFLRGEKFISFSLTGVIYEFLPEPIKASGRLKSEEVCFLPPVSPQCGRPQAHKDMSQHINALLRVIFFKHPVNNEVKGVKGRREKRCELKCWQRKESLKKIAARPRRTFIDIIFFTLPKSPVWVFRPWLLYCCDLNHFWLIPSTFTPKACCFFFWHAGWRQPPSLGRSVIG